MKKQLISFCVHAQRALANLICTRAHHSGARYLCMVPRPLAAQACTRTRKYSDSAYRSGSIEVDVNRGFSVLCLFLQLHTTTPGPAGMVQTRRGHVWGPFYAAGARSARAARARLTPFI